MTTRSEIIRRKVWIALSLAMAMAVPTMAQAGDLDGDGDVDSNDIEIILAALGQEADPGDPRDLNGDGRISILDSRLLTLLCTRSRCADENADLGPLEVEIVTPMDELVTTEDSAEVRGTASGPVHRVTINGVEAALIHGEFTASIDLVEGTNSIVVTAEAGDGDTATSSVSVRRDTDPPLIVIETPAENDRLVSETVTIAGTVNDIIPGATVNDDDVTVTVNSRPASVNNRTFILPDLPLELGENTILAEATDVAGNSRSASITVTREPDLAGIRILITGGNNQSGPINSSLAEPLSVQVLTEDSVPLAGRPVEIMVSKGDGLLDDPSNNRQSIMLLTDGDGNAAVDFTLGSRTGEGFHRVRVTTPGSLTFAEFCATAEPETPVNIAITMAPPARSVVGQALSEPLSVIVTDEGGNPVPGVDVTFRVDFGGGSFSGEQTAVATSNADGVAVASWTLGPDGGVANNQASATFADNPGTPVVFSVSGVETGPASDTTISGTVQDSTGQPIVGARAVLRDTEPLLEAISEADGSFTITGVPPGGHRVGILGSAADDPETGAFFPDIDFAVEAVSGTDNELDQIAILPFLDMAGAKMVGGGEDVILEMDGVSGFAIKVFANSTFVDGVQQPLMMSSSQVKLDKVPMPPPQGSTPMVVGTLQPAGVHFDPPAQVIYPNVAGLSPGDVADIFAFHHDIGQFVNVGPGTVSSDGSVVVSDPGFGIVESGWHCLIRLPGPASSCANGCSAVATWSITQNGTGGGTILAGSAGKPIVLSPAGDPANRQEATVTVMFSPGGTNDASPVWAIQNASTPNPVSFVSPSPDNSNVAVVRADNSGTATLVSPVNRISLTADPDGDKTCQAEIGVVVCKVDSVELTAIDSPLAGNQGSGLPGDAGLGLKIFPGDQVQGETTARNTVEVTVTVDPPMSDVSVFIKAFDMDDPSDDTGLIDNDQMGDDNRGSPRAGRLKDRSGTFTGGTVEIKTDAQGKAITEFETTMNPGDNFRIAAACSRDALNGVAIDMTGLALEDAGGNALPSSGAAESQLLTVWRQLHLEIDDMAGVTGHFVAGAITNVVFNMATGQSTVTVDQNLDDGSPIPNGRFEGGRLTANMTDFPAVSNTTTTVRVTGDARPVNGMNFVLFDDDDIPNLGTVPSPPIDLFTAAFREAFIETEVLAADADSDAPFDLNVENAELSTQLASRQDRTTSPKFWIALLQGGFQGRIQDFDPRSEGAHFGRVDGLGGRNRAGIFLETIRDTRVGIPTSDPDLESKVTLHELGHQFALPHGDLGVMMQGVNKPPKFSKRSISKIRGSVGTTAIGND